MRLRALACLLCLLLGLLAAAPAQAQARPDMGFDAESARALELMKHEKYVEVREIAQRMLDRNPQSPMGNFLMGVVYERAECSLPRAHFYLSRARNTLERPWSFGFPTNGNEELHHMVLLEMIQVTAEMDRYQEELDLLSDYDRVYGPALTSFYGWPLMKLGRIEEARLKSNLALASRDPDSITRALNTLGAIESTVDNADKSYEDFVELCNKCQQNHWDLEAAFLCNAGEAAMVIGKFEDAERYILQATHEFDPLSYSNPWEQLAILYAGQRRFPDAVQALRRMKQWSHARKPRLDQQSWAF
ncbi:MAG: hypothetical protein ACYCW6_26410, partial [Candidatus Xenobia bacterium]